MLRESVRVRAWVRYRVRVSFKVSLLAVYFGRWRYKIGPGSKLDIADRVALSIKSAFT